MDALLSHYPALHMIMQAMQALVHACAQMAYHKSKSKAAKTLTLSIFSMFMDIHELSDLNLQVGVMVVYNKTDNKG